MEMDFDILDYMDFGKDLGIQNIDNVFGSSKTNSNIGTPITRRSK